MLVSRRSRLQVALIFSGIAAGAVLLPALPAQAQSATDIAGARPNVNWRPPTAGAIASSVDLTTAIGLPSCPNGSVLSYDTTRFNGRGWGCVNSVTNATQLGGKTEGQLNVASATNAGYASNSGRLGGKTEGQLNVASANNADYATNSGRLGGKTEGQLNVNSANTASYANNAGLLGGKTEGQLSVASAGNANRLDGLTVSEISSSGNACEYWAYSDHYSSCGEMGFSSNKCSLSPVSWYKKLNAPQGATLYFRYETGGSTGYDVKAYCGGGGWVTTGLYYYDYSP